MANYYKKVVLTVRCDKLVTDSEAARIVKDCLKEQTFYPYEELTKNRCGEFTVVGAKPMTKEA